MADADDAGHQPIIKRLRSAGRDPRAFLQRGVRVWVALAIAALVATFLLPLWWPWTSATIDRTTPALSLFFFLAAVGFWLRMGERAFTVAAGFVVLLYAATAWTPWAYGIDDFAFLALLSSFAVFSMAGFNLVFILEEVVFDAHRELHLVHPAWKALPSVFVAALAIGLPLLDRMGVIHAPTLWVTSVIWTILLLGWWTFRAFASVPDATVLRELHMLAIGTLAATGAVDLARLLNHGAGVVPSIVMYVLLVLTWIYVSYTTLQRTHFLLRADNAVPWLCILLSASFALLQHARFHYRIEGFTAVQVLVQQRVGYLVLGIWLGIGFYVAQALWRILKAIRDDRRMAPRSRIVAGSLARLAEGLLGAERRIGGVAATLYQGMDRLLPGKHVTPRRPDHQWELDEGDLVLVEADGEE